MRLQAKSLKASFIKQNKEIKEKAHGFNVIENMAGGQAPFFTAAGVRYSGI
jgi:hypothetical protein